MPIYEYRCLDCGLKFEYLVRSSEAVVCPGCSSKALKRLVSSFSFTSKDSGGNITASSSGCGGCTSNNCSGCSR